MKAIRLRIKLRAYDYKLLDNSVNEIVTTAKETGARIAAQFLFRQKSTNLLF